MRLRVLLASATLSLTQLSPVSAQVDPARHLKVALVLPGPANNETFNTAAVNGLDAAKAKEVALALIQRGADVLTANGNES